MFCIARIETGSAELRSSTKTKIRLEDIFIYNKRKLAERGVNDAKQFAKIVHAYRARESQARQRALSAIAAALDPENYRGQSPVDGAILAVILTLSITYRH